MPCWEADPGKRLGFAALGATLVTLGASVSDGGEHAFNDVDVADGSKMDDDAGHLEWLKSFDRRDLLGPSVYVNTVSLMIIFTRSKLLSCWT